MSDSQHGHGTVLSDGTITVGNVMSISGPNQTRDSVDVSTMDSTSKTREFVPCMLDPGELTLEMNYDATASGTAHLLDAAQTNTEATWTLTFPGGGTTSTWACKGFITALGHAVPFDDKVTQSLTLKFSGVPSYVEQS